MASVSVPEGRTQVCRNGAHHGGGRKAHSGNPQDKAGNFHKLSLLMSLPFMIHDINGNYKGFLKKNAAGPAFS